MGPAARNGQSDDFTPHSSPPIGSQFIDRPRSEAELAETIEVLWGDDDEHETLKLVGDVERTLKLNERRVDLQRAIAEIIERDESLTEKPNPEHAASRPHPLTGEQTKKISVPCDADLSSPQPAPTTPEPATAPSILVNVLIAMVGAVLGMGLTVLLVLLAPDIAALLPSDDTPIADVRGHAPTPIAAVVPGLPESRASAPGENTPPASTESSSPQAEESEARETTPTAEPEIGSSPSIPDELVLPITFHHGRDHVASSDVEALRSLAQAIIAAPRTRFDLVGYTLPSETNDRARARRLAENRAKVARHIIRGLGPSKRRFSPRAARYQEPLLVDQPVDEPHQAVILRVTRR